MGREQRRKEQFKNKNKTVINNTKIKEDTKDKIEKYSLEYYREEMKKRKQEERKRRLEQKIEQLESDSIKFATDFVKLQEILNEKSQTETELEHKYERWEYLNNLAEEIENSKN